jgi:hypothetical protein
LLCVAAAGLSLGLTGCGSSGPSQSYEQGWDRAVKTAGAADCSAVPADITARSDWTEGCHLGDDAARLHDSGKPASAPTTYPGDP